MSSSVCWASKSKFKGIRGIIDNFRKFLMLKWILNERESNFKNKAWLIFIFVSCNCNCNCFYYQSFCCYSYCYSYCIIQASEQEDLSRTNPTKPFYDPCRRPFPFPFRPWRCKDENPIWRITIWQNYFPEKPTRMLIFLWEMNREELKRASPITTIS